MAWIETIKIDPDTPIDGKGRNGYFRAHTAHVWVSNSLKPEAESTLHLDVYSRRQGDAPPLRLTGKSSAIVTLLSDLLQAALGVAAVRGEGGDVKMTNVVEISDYVNLNLKKGVSHGERNI